VKRGDQKKIRNHLDLKKGHVGTTHSLSAKREMLSSGTNETKQEPRRSFVGLGSNPHLGLPHGCFAALGSCPPAAFTPPPRPRSSLSFYFPVVRVLLFELCIVHLFTIRLSPPFICIKWSCRANLTVTTKRQLNIRDHTSISPASVQWQKNRSSPHCTSFLSCSSELQAKRWSR